jgi:hypothetical protein
MQRHARKMAYDCALTSPLAPSQAGGLLLTLNPSPCHSEPVLLGVVLQVI